MRRPHLGAAFVAISLLFGLGLFAAQAGAETSASLVKFAANGFPDNADLRGRLFAYVIGASKDVALAYGEKQLQSSAGPVTVRVEKRSNDFIVEFLNAGSTGAAAGRGSVYVQRGNAKGNYILQARILLEDDPSCYLSLYPSGSGTRGDVVMYGALVKKGLYFSDMIYRILLLSFSDIVDATSRSFDWAAVFKFGAKNGETEYAAELRSALANPPAADDQAAASSAQIGLGSSNPKVSLAAAPALPVAGAQDSKGPRSLRIASAIEKASSPEALVLDLSTSGETGVREISIAADSAPAFIDAKGDPLAKVVYADFPRYDARGLPMAALRAALFLDLQSNPGSVYAILGEGLRATLVPAYDEAGRLNFTVFSEGKESGWDEFFAPRRDLRVRIVRVPA
jgi:hypothetical protein